MSTLTPRAGAVDRCGNYAVGRLVSQVHALRWCAGVAFLLERCLPIVAAQSAIVNGSGDATFSFRYQRSPGCVAVLVAVTPPCSGLTTAITRVRINGSAAAFIGPTDPSFDGAGFADGATALSTPLASTRSAPVWVAVVDVSGLTVGVLATVDLRLQTGTEGIYGVTVLELPQDQTRPENGDPGADAQSFQHPAKILAFPSTGRGLQALFNGLTDARTKVRRHMQYVWQANAGPITSSTSPVALPGGTWRARARKLHESGVANAMRFYATGAVNAGTGTLTLKANGSTIATLTFGSSTPTAQNAAVSVPTTGTAQLVTFELYWSISTTGNFQLFDVALLEEEA